MVDQADAFNLIEIDALMSQEKPVFSYEIMYLCIIFIRFEESYFCFDLKTYDNNLEKDWVNVRPLSKI